MKLKRSGDSMSSKNNHPANPRPIALIMRIFASFDVIDYIFFVLFAVGMIITVHYIFVGAYVYFNSDTATANVLAREQIMTRQFFPSQWAYVQDVWTFFINVPMVLLSVVIKDQFLLRTTAVFLQSMVLLGVLWAYGRYIFKNNSLLIFGGVLFSCLSMYYMENMFGQAAYGYLSIVLLLTFLPLCFSVSETFEIKRKEMIFACLLLAVVCAGGSRGVGTIIVPAVGAFALVYIIDHHDDPYKKIVKDSSRFFTWLFFILVAMLAGFLVFRHVAATRPFIVGVANPTLRSAFDIDDIAEAFKEVISGFWYLFGVEEKTALFSVAGIGSCMKYVAAMAFMFLFPFLLTRQYRNESLAVKRLTVFSWASLAVTTALYIFTDNLAAGFAGSRYFQVPMVLQIVLSGHYLYKYWIKNSFLIRTVSTLILLSFVMTSLYMGIPISYNNGQRNEMLQSNNKLAQSLKDRGLRMGYASYWNAYNRSALFNFDPEIIALHSGTLIPFYHLTSKRYYEPDYYMGPTFLLLTPSEYEAYQSTASDAGSITSYLGTPEEIYEESGMVILVYGFNIARHFIYP